MREHPWDSRQASVSHAQWFQKLAGLHAATRAWMEELGQPMPAFRLFKSAGPDVLENLELLDRLVDPSPRLDALLDDTLPEETLARLEKTVRAVQGWSLQTVLGRAATQDLPELLNRLEQSSWRSGREWGLMRFPAEHRAQADLREALASLRGAPWFPTPPREGALVRRATHSEARFELLECPHAAPESAPVADALCSLLGHWLRGFLNAYDPTARMSYRAGEPPGRSRCEVSWAARSSP